MKKVSDPPDDYYASALRKRSGSIKTRDLLVEFLYVLMRDQVQPGAVEYVMLQLEAEHHLFGTKPTPLTNGFLARYAIDIAERLKRKIKVKAPKHKKLKLEAVQLPSPHDRLPTKKNRSGRK